MVATDPVPRLTRVDAHLKLLAEVSLAVERAEAAAGEGGFTSAREALDEAEAGLQVLRERWPEMAAAERALVGRAAAPVKQRLDAVAAPAAASERAEPGRGRARSRRRAGPRGGVGLTRAPARDASGASGVEHRAPRSGIGALSGTAQTKVQCRGWRFSAAGVRCALTAVGGMICIALPSVAIRVRRFSSRWRRPRCCSGPRSRWVPTRPPAFTSPPDVQGDAVVGATLTGGRGVDRRAGADRQVPVAPLPGHGRFVRRDRRMPPRPRTS